MWLKCLETLALLNQPRLIHYGSYETQFLGRMKARYTGDSINSDLIDHLISSSLNLLSFTYAQIYFPTYSNTLKEVARFLGFEWSERDPSGLRALMWRSEWESSRDSGIKQKLMTYNAEDCAAIEKVADAIARVCDEQRTTDAAVDSINVKSLVSEYPEWFAPLNFAVPAFEQINAAAYWDYQRNKVYVRSNNRVRRATRRRQRSSRKPVRINKFIEIIDQRPARCARCGRLSSIETANSRVWFTISDFPAPGSSVGSYNIRLIDTYVAHVSSVSMRFPGKADTAGIWARSLSIK
jgi:hypothetical protein